ncbi:hypothetical protein [Glycomyces artemisiae]|uniref:Uncharacterized protein n=1 Tax=Glycomyces artemisiae TaxID=1076443 RepID=A0A2T0UG16_9ACTN|nr:hypothetical protein [Glycomyces artemisiae]PRY56818.1 hypothetical protein B0I28_108129 [Glycomyces artemisiae]
MPRTPRTDPDTAPFNVRREVAIAVLLPLFAVAVMCAFLWLDLFSAEPLPLWGEILGVAVVAAPAVAGVVLCFRGRARRNWKAAMVFPATIVAAATVQISAFNQFALVHHGVDVECTVAHRTDYVAETDEGDLPRSAHEFRCVGWDSPTLTTDREEALRLSEVRIVVFDPLGRVDPDFGDPSLAGGLAFAPLSLLFFAAGALSRLYLVDDGSLKAAAAARFRRMRRRRRG